MENKKDTNNNTGLSIGHDINGQPENLLKIMEISSSFVSFSYKRAEQIAEAIYMVSDYFDESEPMKENMRSVVLDIVSEIHVLHSLPPFESFMHYEVIKGRLKELFSFVKISENCGLLAPGNAHILRREIALFDSVLSYVRDNKHTKSDKFLGGVSIPIENVFEYENLQKSESQKDMVKTPFIKTSNQSIKEKKSEEKKVYHVEEKEHKISRRNLIIKFITEKKNVTIKDIMSVIKDCSEKTIQRELVSLMNEGVLKREGEKRWAKYSLK